MVGDSRAASRSSGTPVYRWEEAKDNGRSVQQSKEGVVDPAASTPPVLGDQDYYLGNRTVQGMTHRAGTTTVENEGEKECYRYDIRYGVIYDFQIDLN